MQKIEGKHDMTLLARQIVVVTIPVDFATDDVRSWPVRIRQADKSRRELPCPRKRKWTGARFNRAQESLL
jgi:hypothetical protein